MKLKHEAQFQISRFVLSIHPSSLLNFVNYLERRTKTSFPNPSPELRSMICHSRFNLILKGMSQEPLSTEDALSLCSCALSIVTRKAVH